jgi:hypothetical protein
MEVQTEQKIVEKLEEGLGVTSRNCCLDHCPDPVYGV